MLDSSNNNNRLVDFLNGRDTGLKLVADENTKEPDYELLPLRLIPNNNDHYFVKTKKRKKKRIDEHKKQTTAQDEAILTGLQTVIDLCGLLDRYDVYNNNKSDKSQSDHKAKSRSRHSTKQEQPQPSNQNLSAFDAIVADFDQANHSSSKYSSPFRSYASMSPAESNNRKSFRSIDENDAIGSIFKTSLLYPVQVGDRGSSSQQRRAESPYVPTGRGIYDPDNLPECCSKSGDSDTSKKSKSKKNKKKKDKKKDKKKGKKGKEEPKPAFPKNECCIPDCCRKPEDLEKKAREMEMLCKPECCLTVEDREWRVREMAALDKPDCCLSMEQREKKAALKGCCLSPQDKDDNDKELLKKKSCCLSKEDKKRKKQAEKEAKGKGKKGKDETQSPRTSSGVCSNVSQMTPCCRTREDIEGQKKVMQVQPKSESNSVQTTRTRFARYPRCGDHPVPYGGDEYEEYSDYEVIEPNMPRHYYPPPASRGYCFDPYRYGEGYDERYPKIRNPAPYRHTSPMQLSKSYDPRNDKRSVSTYRQAPPEQEQYKPQNQEFEEMRNKGLFRERPQGPVRDPSTVYPSFQEERIESLPPTKEEKIDVTPPLNLQNEIKRNEMNENLPVQCLCLKHKQWACTRPECRPSPEERVERNICQQHEVSGYGEAECCHEESPKVPEKKKEPDDCCLLLADSTVAKPKKVCKEKPQKSKFTGGAPYCCLKPEDKERLLAEKQRRDIANEEDSGFTPAELEVRRRACTPDCGLTDEEVKLKQHEHKGARKQTKEERKREDKEIKNREKRDKLARKSAEKQKKEEAKEREEDKKRAARRSASRSNSRTSCCRRSSSRKDTRTLQPVPQRNSPDCCGLYPEERKVHQPNNCLTQEEKEMKKQEKLVDDLLARQLEEERNKKRGEREPKDCLRRKCDSKKNDISEEDNVEKDLDRSKSRQKIMIADKESEQSFERKLRSNKNVVGEEDIVDEDRDTRKTRQRTMSIDKQPEQSFERKSRSNKIGVSEEHFDEEYQDTSKIRPKRSLVRNSGFQKNPLIDVEVEADEVVNDRMYRKKIADRYVAQRYPYCPPCCERANNTFLSHKDTADENIGTESERTLTPRSPVRGRDIQSGNVKKFICYESENDDVVEASFFSPPKRDALISTEKKFEKTTMNESTLLSSPKRNALISTEKKIEKTTADECICTDKERTPIHYDIANNKQVGVSIPSVPNKPLLNDKQIETPPFLEPKVERVLCPSKNYKSGQYQRICKECESETQTNPIATPTDVKVICFTPSAEKQIEYRLLEKSVNENRENSPFLKPKVERVVCTTRNYTSAQYQRMCKECDSEAQTNRVPTPTEVKVICFTPSAEKQTETRLPEKSGREKPKKSKKQKQPKKEKKQKKQKKKRCRSKSSSSTTLDSTSSSELSESSSVESSALSMTDIPPLNIPPGDFACQDCEALQEMMRQLALQHKKCECHVFQDLEKQLGKFNSKPKSKSTETKQPQESKTSDKSPKVMCHETCTGELPSSRSLSKSKSELSSSSMDSQQASPHRKSEQPKQKSKGQCATPSSPEAEMASKAFVGLPCGNESMVKKTLIDCRKSRVSIPLVQPVIGLCTDGVCGGTSVGADRVQNVKYAQVKITEFPKFLTYEVMRATPKKPRHMPSYIEQLFVTKKPSYAERRQPKPLESKTKDHPKGHLKSESKSQTDIQLKCVCSKEKLPVPEKETSSSNTKVEIAQTEPPPEKELRPSYTKPRLPQKESFGCVCPPSNDPKKPLPVCATKNRVNFSNDVLVREDEDVKGCCRPRKKKSKTKVSKGAIKCPSECNITKECKQTQHDIRKSKSKER